MNSSKLLPELKVKDFKKSLEFYTQLAGFTVMYDRPEENFARLTREGAEIMIEEYSSTDQWQVGKLEYPLGRGINFEIEVSDVQALYDNFKKNNWPIFWELEEKWYRTGNVEGGNRQFLVQDPDGYLLRFAQDLGKRKL